MTLGTTIDALGSPRKEFDCVAPMSVSSGWLTIIDAGGPAVQDAATITNPTTQITASTRHIFRRQSFGTILLMRLGYPSGLGTITNPIVKVFGRSDSNQAWQLNKTRAGSLTGTLTTASTDVTDGTLLYTTPDYDTISWDCLGCNEILVGVQTALAGTTGSTATAIVQAKWI